MLDLIMIFGKGFIIWILISVFLILLTNKKQKIFSLSLFFYGFIFLFLRLYANQIIYSKFNHLQNDVVGQTWATYSLRIPIFYFILIAQFGIIYQKNKLFLDSKFIIFSLTSLYSIIVLLTFNLSIKEISKHAKNNLYGTYTEL